MNTNVYAAPVRQGKEQKLRELASLLQGEHRSEAERLRREMGVDREQVFVQATPMGEVAVVAWDTDDMRAAFQTALESQREHAQWFRDQLSDIHGIDLSGQAPPPAKVGAEWQDEGWSYGANEEVAIAFPLKPGRSEDALGFMRTLTGDKRDEFVRTRREFGIVRQMFFLLQTPQGDFGIMYGEGERPDWFERAFHTTATSDDPFLTWWRDSVMQFAALPLFEQPTPKVEKIVDIKTRVPARA